MLEQLIREAATAEKNNENQGFVQNVANSFVREETPLELAIKRGIYTLNKFKIGKSNIVQRECDESIEELQRFLDDTF
ncbi:hypothetical protein SAMN04487866_12622 [Thermoactinomyces sp. DSM 45891]|uniref:hypothetical protein n=1 Tax=Thermoactinomyces sp. DSM 45891 TaxID=1761907 RepID=UPI000914F16D|nr:hypothetical protein [Thermoactinomyces sp. DSM 45891]SFX79476.1 hypothetical protein SAMN04487866_12622 [Thermoactinomyces sp. DSM 45891]